MANNEDLTIDLLITQTPGSAPGSSVQASAAQPKTGQKPKTTGKNKRRPIRNGGPHVDKSEKT